MANRDNGGVLGGAYGPIAWGQHGATGTWGVPSSVEFMVQSLDPKLQDMARRQYLRMIDPSWLGIATSSGLLNFAMGTTLPFGYLPWLYGDEPKGYKTRSKR